MSSLEEIRTYWPFWGSLRSSECPAALFPYPMARHLPIGDRRRFFMTRFLRRSALISAALLLAMSTFAEERSLWRTSSDVREGVVGNAIGTVTDIQSGNRFVIGPDDDKYSTIL